MSLSHATFLLEEERVVISRPEPAPLKGGAGKVSKVHALDARGDFREHLVEHDPGHQEGQSQVEGLTADVQDDGLAALEVTGEFLEVGGKTDGDEGQSEEPR